MGQGNENRPTDSNTKSTEKNRDEKTGVRDLRNDSGRGKGEGGGKGRRDGSGGGRGRGGGGHGGRFNQNG